MSVLGDIGGLDLRPRVVFWTSAGAVIVLVDPTSVVGGMATFPIIGAVPYSLDIDPATGQPSVRLDFPTGPYLLPISLSGGQGGSVDLPGLGPATYEVVIGPPQIPEDQLATPASLLFSGLTSMGPLLILGGGLLLLLILRRR